MLLWTPAVAILLGVTSPSVSPAPLPCPGSGLATPPRVSGPGLDWLYLLVHAKFKKGHTWGSNLPEAAFRVGVKAAGFFPGDELGCSWGPLQYSYFRGSRP